MKTDKRRWSCKLVAGIPAIGLAAALCAASAAAVTTEDVDAWITATARIGRITPPSHSRFPGTYIHVMGNGADVRGFVGPGTARVGSLRNGPEVMILPVDSGGSGGVFAALVFTRTPHGGSAFVDVLPSRGDHLEVSIAEGQIRARAPISPGADRRGRPSGFRYELYTLRDWELVKLKSWTSAQ